MDLKEYSYGEFRFKGICEGGIESAVAIPSWKMSVDIGRGHPALTDCRRILLTHGHLDHSSGIAYHASQRSLKKLPPAEIFCPEEISDPLRNIMDQWSVIEGFQIPAVIIPVKQGDEFTINSNRYFKALKAWHRIPALGYHVFEKRNRLKKEFLGLSGIAIAELKKKRSDLFEEIHIPLISFSGDSRIEFVLEQEEVRKSEILFLECTYLDSERPVSRAREWGHTHLFEIRDNAEAFSEIKKIYLTHISPRYSAKMVHYALKTVLPDFLYKKTVPFMYGGA